MDYLLFDCCRELPTLMFNYYFKITLSDCTAQLLVAEMIAKSIPVMVLLKSAPFLIKAAVD